MINLNEFSDLVPKSGRYSTNTTYIKLTDSQCSLVLGKSDYEQVTKYLGNTVNIKVNGDLSILVLTKGADRRIGSVGRDLSVTSIKERPKQIFGESIKAIYFECGWDEDETGRKVYVLRYNNRKEYAADATIRRLKDGRA